MNEKEFETLGIILSIKPHNDNDAIVKVLLSNDILFLYAKGIQKPLSKNRANLQILSLVNLEIINSKIVTGIKTLKRATLKTFFPYSNANIQEYYDTINYFLNKQLKNSNLKILIDKYSEILNNIKDHPIHSICYFLLIIIEINGLKPIFNKCIECDNVDNITDFEFYKGGFLCHKHSSSTKDIKLLRSIYWLNHDLDSFIKKATENEALTIKIMLLDYLKNII